MVRLYLFVEGPTEQTFAHNVLLPHLARFGVYMQPAVEIAHARRRGKVHRRGGRKYQPMRDDIARFTRQERGAEVFFSSLIDLYALAPDFPGLAEAESLRYDPYRRVAALERAWAADQNERRFIPFLVLHEFETFLFAKTRGISAVLPGRTAIGSEPPRHRRTLRIN